MAILFFMCFRNYKMDNINFTSQIKPVKFSDYRKFVSTMNRKNFVDYPWTTEESKIGQNVYTEDICDCTSCLITTGKEALLMHLCPSVKENHFFDNVLLFLRNHLDLKADGMQAIVTGSKNTKKSQDIFNKFLELLDYLNIPTTVLKNGKSPVNIAYKTSKDEFVISNLHIDRALKNGKSSKDALKSGFESVKISDKDELI